MGKVSLSVMHSRVTQRKNLYDLSLIDGPVGCSQFGAMTRKAAVSIFVHDVGVPFGVESLGHRADASGTGLDWGFHLLK